MASPGDVTNRNSGGNTDKQGGKNNGAVVLWAASSPPPASLRAGEKGMKNPVSPNLIKRPASSEPDRDLDASNLFGADDGGLILPHPHVARTTTPTSTARLSSASSIITSTSVISTPAPIANAVGVQSYSAPTNHLKSCHRIPAASAMTSQVIPQPSESPSPPVPKASFLRPWGPAFGMKEPSDFASLILVSRNRQTPASATTEGSLPACAAASEKAKATAPCVSETSSDLPSPWSLLHGSPTFGAGRRGQRKRNAREDLETAACELVKRVR